MRLKFLFLPILIVALVGCDRLSTQNSNNSQRNLAQLDSAVTDLEHHNKKLEKQLRDLTIAIEENSKRNLAKWVLWKIPIYANPRIGFTPQPASPLDAYDNKDNCIEYAQKWTKRFNHLNSNETFDFRCLPEATDPRPKS